MCWQAGVSRAGYYRRLLSKIRKKKRWKRRAAIQEIAFDHRRRYGYRRIAAEFRRRGMKVNHKRVVRLMREDNLLAIRSRRYVITTDSRHQLEVYVNLARRMKLTGVNQFWVADFTYIRLKPGVRLSGGRARCVVAAGSGLGARPVRWRRAGDKRRWSGRWRNANRGRGLVHHSDRGIQYACHDYVSLLKATPDDTEHEPAGKPLRQRDV